MHHHLKNKKKLCDQPSVFAFPSDPPFQNSTCMRSFQVFADGGSAALHFAQRTKEETQYNKLAFSESRQH